MLPEKASVSQKATSRNRPRKKSPLQALCLLNDPLVHEQSKRFADRLVATHPDDSARLQLACTLAFARLPSPEETADAKHFLHTTRAKLCDAGTPDDKLDAEAWQAMVRVLFRLNEFVYLD